MKEENLDSESHEQKTEDQTSEKTSQQNTSQTEEDKRRKAYEHLYDNDNEFDDPIEGDPTKIRINTSVRDNISAIFDFLKDTVSFKDGADIGGTIKNIREGINFAGPNVWVLICSIIVASVGLNTNSVAVIIGAMLISPLMGPIRGMGLGVGTNDIQLIVDSLKNFGVAVGISLLTAYLYFLITPLHGLTPEIEARTGPNLMDVFIAFFGGLAGIIAASRGDNSTVIPGVAIATALMPPLCTAGYGLANGNWNFFFGASYLFLINTLFICLSTILVVRYLKFPIRHFINPKVEKKVKIVSTLLIFLVIVPSVYLFYGKVQETLFIENSDTFVQSVIEADPSLNVDKEIEYNDGVPKVRVALINKIVPESTLQNWYLQLENYGLKRENLEIVQGKDMEKLLNDKLEQLRKENIGSDAGFDVIRQKDELIRNLNSQILSLQGEISNFKENSINAETLAETVALHHPEIENIEILTGINAEKANLKDTVFALAVHYYDSIKNIDEKSINEKLKKQLEIQLKGQGLLNNCKVKVYSF